MKTNDFNSSFSAKISADEAIKKISKVPEWWGITFTGSAEKLNDKFVVKMGGDSFFDFTVTELLPGKRIVWLVTDCYMPWYSDKKEWANTRLIFDLKRTTAKRKFILNMKVLRPMLNATRTATPAGPIGSKQACSLI